MRYCTKMNEINQYQKTGGTTEIPRYSKWIDSETDKMYCYDGNEWQEIRDEPGKIIDIWV